VPAKSRNECAQEAYPRFDLEENNYGLAATDFKRQADRPQSRRNKPRFSCSASDRRRLAVVASRWVAQLNTRQRERPVAEAAL
jgi:hypothetical protein